MKKTFSVLSTFALSAGIAHAQADGGKEEAIVVTASRSGAGVPAGLLGASATLLDADRLEERQTRVVSDILRDVPGVAVSRSGAVGGQTQLRLRGTEGNHVLLLIDGIEAADPYYGEYDFGTLIAEPAARVEVLRGQQSSLYGSDAIGGVIHYITASGGESPGFELRGEGGTDGTASAAARAAGVRGPLALALSAAWYRTDGYPTARGGERDIGAEQFVVSGKADLTLSPVLRLSAVARYSDSDVDTNNFSFDGPTLGRIIDSPGTGYSSRAVHGLVALRYDGEAFTAALGAQLSDFARKGRSAGATDSDTEGQRLKASLEIGRRLVTGAADHRLTLAVDAERETFRNVLGAFGAFRGELDSDNLGIVGQYELFMEDRLSLGASVRHDRNQRFGDSTTFRLQGSYTLPTGTRLHAAYGTGVKNPTYFELFGTTDRYIGSPGLKPEKSEGFEAGVEQGFGSGAATLGATYFRSRLTDEIFTLFGFPSTSANRSSRSRQQGVEVALAVRPVRQIRLDAAWTWLDAEESGADEVRRPAHVASFNAAVSSRDERFAATLTLRYNGDQRDTAFDVPPFGSPRTALLSDYLLVNLAASFRLTDRLELFGRVENATDEAYEEVFSYVAPGRSAVGGVRLRF